MTEYKGIKSVKRVGKGITFSIQNNEEDLLRDEPNYLVEGCVSKNSKHACVHKDSKVLTQRGYVPINKLEENDRVAFLDSSGEIKLTKK